MRVFKYAAPLDDTFEVRLPVGAQILSVGEQGVGLYFWALVNPDADMQTRRFHWRRTGHQADGVGRFVGTVLVQGGARVFHLFEALP
jgi:hypothetical protein